MSYDLKPLDFDPPALAAYAKLLRDVFPDARQYTPEFLTWQYVENPAGRAVGFNAYDGDSLAAHYVALPCEATVFGAKQRGLLSLNTATHPAHQGKKLFTTLADATYARAASEGFEFVVGVANANSTPGFVRKLGFTLLAPLEARLGVMAVRRGAARDLELAMSWTAERLAWRVRNPAGRYRVQGKGASATLEASTGRPGIHAVLYEASAGEAPLPGVPARASALAPIKLWIGMDASVDWRRSLYRPVPRVLRPSPLNLIFRPLGARSKIPSAAAVSFHAIDFDAY